MSEARSFRHAEVIEVICVEFTRGKGINEDPVRLVHQYWSKEGKLLAEDDECQNKGEIINASESYD